MFTKQQKIILVRHGAPLDRGDSSLNPDLLTLLDQSAKNISDELASKEIGRVVLLSSETRRTRETAQYIGANLCSEFNTSAVTEASQLSLATPLGGIQPQLWHRATLELSDFIDRVADESSAVIAVTHEPVIFSVATVASVEPDLLYGGITVLK